ncbi:MAG: peptidase dimerization domain-containing protein [Oligoflexia bacterium]|nr:peptidase dimerization domain-containing protein [Oligoflexia bacterium]
MQTSKTALSVSIVENIKALLPGLEKIYTDIHAHPELSMQEVQTAARTADHLRSNGFEVTTGVGKAGVITSAGDSLQIRMFGRGAHGSMPQASIDPVVMAASTVLRLQTIVSRELAPTEAAVVTIGALQAGTKENVIPDEAIIKLNVRTFDEGVRQRVLDSTHRIVNAEATASGAPKAPEFKVIDHYPLTKNDPEATRKVLNSLRNYFPADRIHETEPTSASEDFGCFGAEWGAPSVFWFIGGTDPDLYAKAQASNRLRDLPTNHSPRFAPVLHPTLETGVLAMISAAMAWLEK